MNESIHIWLNDFIAEWMNDWMSVSYNVCLIGFENEWMDILLKKNLIIIFINYLTIKMLKADNKISIICIRGLLFNNLIN